MLNMPRKRIVNRLALALATMIGCAGLPAASERHHRLSVDDVLDTVGIDQAATSPDGALEAVSVQRPASDGEVFGRTAYEIDPSRNDVWIVSHRGGPARNLTNGKSAAAGYWCPTWSPDGKRLAMLSTRPEGGEPRGGDNVRLYLWDRAKDMLKRLDEQPVVTQTRYGSPMYQLDLRDGSSQAISPKACRGYDENAPFVWLDDHRLLALTLPNGAVSGLLDQFGRSFAHTVATRDALRTGRSPTLTISESGSERPSGDDAMVPAQLRLFDVSTGTATTIADLPMYPFQGALTISISPDGKQAAIMASTGPLLPASGKRLPYNDDAWLVQKRLGFVALTPGSGIRWVEAPPEARHPLELFAWSPGSSKVAMRARGAPEDRVSTLFVVEASSSIVSTAGRGLEIVDPTAGPYDHDPVAMWIDDEHLVAKARPTGSTRTDWWRMGPGNRQENVTSALAEPPAGWRRQGETGLIGISGRMVAVLSKGDAMASTLRLPLLAKNTAFAVPAPNVGDRIVLTSEGEKGQQIFSVLSTNTGQQKSAIEIPKAAELLESDDGALIWKEPRRTGLLLMRRAFDQEKATELLHLNRHLAEVSWGRTELVDYVSLDGSSLKAAVILPPGYRSGRRYPVIVWVYGGFVVHDAENYFTDPYLPGIYNLQLYAARDYVVLIPSMPWKRDAAKNDSYPWLPNGVLPAIDRLIQTGVADPDRVAVMGQSFGGYSVYSLITQTNRFKAAIAMAGVTDLTQASYQFDPTARGYPGIEHQKSVNWSIIEISNGLGGTPLDDPEMYRRNSPLSYVDRVNSPLLMIHGEYDIRGGSSHAETFFSALYRQKKKARLLRYWGETHSLAQSPANVRSIVDEVLSWLSTHLKVPAPVS